MLNGGNVAPMKPFSQQMGVNEKYADAARMAMSHPAMLDHAERADLLALVDKLPDDPAVEPVIAWDAPMDSRLRTDPQLRAALRALGVEPPE